MIAAAFFTTSVSLIMLTQAPKITNAQLSNFTSEIFFERYKQTSFPRCIINLKLKWDWDKLLTSFQIY